MKCVNCGAEVDSENKSCPYCGSELIKEQPVTTVTNNYYGNSPVQNQTSVFCPRCGSRNVKFRREEVGNKKSKKSKQVFYRTVSICQDCGNTWNSNGEAKKSGHGVGWWILAILFWPIVLSVWFYKTNDVKLDKKYRIIIIAAFWIILIIIGAVYPRDEVPAVADNTPVNASETMSASADTKSTEEISDYVPNPENPIYILTGETLGEYGRKIVLNPNTDMPESKYLYKLPAGTYIVSTNEEYAAFSIVKDEIGKEEGNEEYPDILQYSGDVGQYQLTSGENDTNDLNGYAKRNYTVQIGEDESFQIVGTETITFEKIG